MSPVRFARVNCLLQLQTFVGWFVYGANKMTVYLLITDLTA